MSFERVAIEQFKEHLSAATGTPTVLGVRYSDRWKFHLNYPELSSVAIGGRIVEVSDEFFAEAFHLLLVEVSRSWGACIHGRLITYIPHR